MSSFKFIRVLYGILYWIHVIYAQAGRCPEPTEQLKNLQWSAVYEHYKNEIGARFELSCPDGATLSGSKFVICLKEGQWSSPFPECVKGFGCKMSDKPSNGNFTALIPIDRETAGLEKGYFPEGTKLNYSCISSDYKLQGKQQRICLFGGTWNEPEPQCVFIDTEKVITTTAPKRQMITCQHPGEPENGFSDQPQATSFNVGGKLTFGCADGFRLSGQLEIFCFPNGRWSDPIPRCASQITCKIPENPENGKIEARLDDFDSVFQKGFLPERAIILYHCKSSIYRLNDGPVQSVCLNDGTWTGSEYGRRRCFIECGTSVYAKTPFIISGKTSLEGEWPWQVALTLKISTAQFLNINTAAKVSDEYSYLCGGVLIHARWILTAAHCVTLPRTKDLMPKEDFLIQLGKYYIDDKQSNGTLQNRKVVYVTTHPNYDPILLTSDIALLRLDTPVEFSEFVVPACLPDDSIPLENEERKGIIAGWGVTKETPFPDKLQHAVMSWAQPSVCEKELKRDRDSPVLHPTVGNDAFCAKSVISTTGGVGGWTCSGDSGGPLVFPVNKTDKRQWVLEGLVSWGIENCDTPYSVFVKVRHFMTWIRSLV